MIPFEEALSYVQGFERVTGTELIHYGDSLGRVLAEDVISDTEMPPFDKSAMDGFACRRSDLSGMLQIIETVPAGYWPEKTVGQGQCTRIMTGAPIPQGADMVIIVEETAKAADGMIRFTGKTDGNDNIARRGEDIARGDTVLHRGKIIRPQDIAVMAACGHVNVRVARKPVAAIISTGSEIVEPHTLPGPSQIRNSNSPQLAAQVERAGATAKYFGIAPDNEEDTYRIVKEALSECEVVILTGGVSMGDYDKVPEVLTKAGVRILFDRVAVQPGKPTTFGTHDNGVVFGLPGNPVSAFMMFEMLVRPLLMKMMGCDWKQRMTDLTAEQDISRSSTGRLGLIPVSLTAEGSVRQVEYHGSAHISSLSKADGIVLFPKGTGRVMAGSRVKVILLD